MRFLLIAALGLFLVSPASAQDMLRDHRAKDPMAQILGEDGKVPQNVADYANVYYQSCTASNQDEALKNYVTQQCACTAASMTEFMTIDNMKTLFTSTTSGDFQQGRVLILAYIPCLEESIHDFVFDNCYTPENEKAMNYPRGVCECFARGMGHYVSETGQNRVPGFGNERFDSAQSVPNPFAYIINNRSFVRRSNLMYEKCVAEEEYGYNK